MRRTRSIFISGIVILGLVSPLQAQTNEEAFEQFQWHVSAPGARARAMGGAIVASGGDATAVLLNPAALTKMTRPHASVEFKSADQRVDRLAAVDSLITGATATFRETTNAVSFVGAAIPLRGNKMAIGVSRHELITYKTSFRLAPRVLPGLVGVARAVSPVASTVDFRAVSHAASIGVAPHHTVRLGLTVSLDRLHADISNSRYDIIAGRDAFDLMETPVMTNQSRIDDADTGVGFVAGAMYQPARMISLGLVYSRRPSFTVREDFQLNSGRQRGANGPLVSQVGFPKAISIDIPDEISAGLAVHPHWRITLAFDAARIGYSSLGKGVVPIIGFDLIGADEFHISDGNEVRLGGEFNIASERNPVFLRGGVSTIPDHRLKFVGDVQPGPTITAAQAQRINVLERSAFNVGRDQTDVRGTFGGGFAIGRNGLVDIGYVWRRELVVSVAGRF